MKRDCLDKDVSDKLSWLASKIKDFQMYQCYNIAILVCKSGKSWYKKVQRVEEDGKSQRGRENY